eukprot:s1130_g19.t1
MSESKLSLQNPEMNQEIATFPAQVRHFKGEASELVAKGPASSAQLSKTDKDSKVAGVVSNGQGSSGSDDKINKLIHELEDQKKERTMIVKSLEESHVVELKKIRDELTEMETKKDKYKSYCTQLDERITEEEAACTAESEAYEKIRNKYKEQVKELNELENKSSSRVSGKEFEKVTVPP